MSQIPRPCSKSLGHAPNPLGPHGALLALCGALLALCGSLVRVGITLHWSRYRILAAAKCGWRPAGELPGSCRRVVPRQLGAWKTWFCLEMVSKFEIRAFPATQIDCMVPRRPLGRLASPQTPPENGFTGIFPIWGKIGDGPWPSCIFPIGPLWAYRALFPLFGVRCLFILS